MKIMPALRTGVLATLIGVTPITKALSQTADSANRIPFIKFPKPNSTLFMAQSGIARGTYTGGFGIQLPKVFSIQPKGKEVLAGNLDFMGLVMRKKRYSDGLAPNWVTRGSLSMPAIGNNDSRFNLKIQDVATFNLTASELKPTGQPYPHAAYKYEEQTELSNLLGPIATLYLGKEKNTKIMAMIGNLTSNQIVKPALGYMVSVVKRFKGTGFMGFFKIEKAGSVSMGNVGVIYRAPSTPKHK